MTRWKYCCKVARGPPPHQIFPIGPFARGTIPRSELHPHKIRQRPNRHGKRPSPDLHQTAEGYDEFMHGQETDVGKVHVVSDMDAPRHTVGFTGSCPELLLMCRIVGLPQRDYQSPPGFVREVGSAAGSERWLEQQM